MYAVSAFWYGVKGVGLVPAGAGEWAGTRADVAAGGAAFCRRSYADIKLDTFAFAYCFNIAYIERLLAAYGVGMNTTDVTYAEKIGGYNVGWALGAQLFFIAEQACALGPDDGSLARANACHAEEKVLRLGLGLGVPLSLGLGGMLGLALARRRGAAARRNAGGALAEEDGMETMYRPV